MAMVAGMSRITRDVPPYMLVEGNPTRVRSLNLVGLKRRRFTSEDIKVLKKAFRLLYHEGLSLKGAIAQLDLLSETESIQYLRNFLQLATSQGRRGLIPGKKQTVENED
jgi:UDP-N-acetylglucosamine acyltransferase